MGVDKALMRVDGPPLVEGVASALIDAGAASVVVQGGDGPAVSALGCQWRADASPGAGPLVATAQALEEADRPVAVVAACDLAWLTSQDVRELLERLESDPGAVAAVPVLDGRAQRSIVAWRSAQASRLARLVADGARALASAFDGAPVADLEPSEPRRWRDVDEPADVRRYAAGARTPEEPT
jgi:molybdopterin-guanine dinucleotide biosynthesis protein A